jgi:hypothetical protein
MYSSGETAVVTADAGWVPVIQIPAGEIANSGYAINEGAAPGFFRINGVDSPSGRLPAGGSVAIREPFTLLEVKRDGGTDLSGVYGIGFP